MEISNGEYGFVIGNLTEISNDEKYGLPIVNLTEITHKIADL